MDKKNMGETKCCGGNDCCEKDMKQYFCSRGRNDSHGGNAVYGLGFIGAAIYFIGQATTFWAGIVGLLKAIVWPAYLVFWAFELLAK